MALKQYIGARYVTKIYENSLNPLSAEWEADVNYEPLTMVTYNYGSYLSKKNVPATIGNPSDNPTYWVQTGFYNGQIAYLYDQVTLINGVITDLGGDITNLETLLNTRVTTPESFGAVGDGTTDDTAAINLALAAAETINFKSGTTYLIDAEVSLLLHDGNILNGNGATLKIKTNDADSYVGILASEVSDIYIRGLNIVGERDTHTGATGEWGMGISLRAAKNVIIEQCNISNCWGDGLYVGSSGTNEDDPCINVIMRDCVLTGNRRNAVSLINFDGLEIHGCTFKDTIGTAPQSGIDVESNDAGQKTDNLHVYDCKFINNQGNQFYVCNIGQDSVICLHDCYFEGLENAIIIPMKLSNYLGNTGCFVDVHDITINGYYRSCIYFGVNDTDSVFSLRNVEVNNGHVYSGALSYSYDNIIMNDASDTFKNIFIDNFKVISLLNEVRRTVSFEKVVNAVIKDYYINTNSRSASNLTDCSDIVARNTMSWIIASNITIDTKTAIEREYYHSSGTHTITVNMNNENTYRIFNLGGTLTININSHQYTLAADNHFIVTKTMNQYLVETDGTLIS